jgi:hypothetical protein
VRGTEAKICERGRGSLFPNPECKKMCVVESIRDEIARELG